MLSRSYFGHPSDKHLSTSLEAVNNRLLISFHGIETAHFDPQPAAAAFLRADSNFQLSCLTKLKLCLPSKNAAAAEHQLFDVNLPVVKLCLYKFINTNIYK